LRREDDRRRMSGFFFTKALTADGWAENLRLTVHGGRVSSAAPDTAPQAGDERHAIGLPGLGNLHSHAFQRAMAGLAERRGPQRDDFWTWRETMYRLALRMTADDVEAV